MGKKNLIKFLSQVMGLLFITVISFMTASCNRHTSSSELPFCDSTTVSTTDSVEDSVFSSIDDVIQYKIQLAEEQTADSVILHTPDPILYNVCKVLVNRQKTFTKSELAVEYLNNYSIYDNIQKNEQAVEPEKDPPLRTESRDTVINGRKCTIISKFY